MGWRELLDTDTKTDPIWKENPVDFKTFVESPDFCNFSLSPVQYEEIMKSLTKDPKKLFTDERKVRLNILVWGKGSGKGTCSSILMLYISYVLLCMRDCHSYFGVAKEDPISIVNVALSGDQAQRFFKRFRNRLLSNPWFRKYRIVDQNKLIEGSGLVYDQEITVTSSVIQFPNNVEFRSLHSQQEKWEDLTIIAFVCDEISGFTSETGQYNADSIWRTLTMSTRELPWIGVLTSFPRLDEDNDFILKKYNEMLKDNSGAIVGSRYYTWQVKPQKFYSGEYFNFVIDEKTGETVPVPIEYLNDAKDPEGFKSRFMCMPGRGIGDFFQYRSYLDRIRRIEPVVKTVDEYIESGGRIRLAKKIVSVISDEKPRVIAIDAGEVDSDAVVVIGYVEQSKSMDKQNVEIVVDGIIVWTPSAKRDVIVDMNNFQDVILELCSRFNVIKVRMDHWNAASIESNLSQKGIVCEIKNADYVSYSRLRTALYTGSLVLADVKDEVYNSDGVLVEMDRVRQFSLQCSLLKTRGNQKPRVEYGKQDLIDALAHICDVLVPMITVSGDEFPVAIVTRGTTEQRVLPTDEVKEFMFGRRTIRDVGRKHSQDEEDALARLV